MLIRLMVLGVRQKEVLSKCVFVCVCVCECTGPVCKICMEYMNDNKSRRRCGL